MLAKPLQSCPTLCNSMDCSPPGSSVHGILQARVLEWVAMPSSRESSQPRDRTRVSWIAGGFFITEPPRKPLHGHTGCSFLLAVYAVPGRLSTVHLLSLVHFVPMVFSLFSTFSHLVSNTWILKYVLNHVLLRPHYLFTLMNKSYWTVTSEKNV